MGQHLHVFNRDENKQRELNLHEKRGKEEEKEGREGRTERERGEEGGAGEEGEGGEEGELSQALTSRIGITLSSCVGGTAARGSTAMGSKNAAGPTSCRPGAPSPPTTHGQALSHYAQLRNTMSHS